MRQWWVIACCLLANISYALELTAQEKAWLLAHPTLQVGSGTVWQPYEFIDTHNQYRGIIADYLALISQKLGIRLSIVKDKSWIEIKSLLAQKQIDMSPIKADILQHNPALMVSQPYISFPMVILTRTDDAFIGALADLNGQRVGVEAHYFANDLLQKNFPHIQRVTYNSTRDLLSALTLHQIDYVLTNHATAVYVVQNLRMTGIKLAATTPFELPLTIAVRNDWPEFVLILNKAIADISPQEHQQIRQRWLSMQASPSQMGDIGRLYPDMILLLVLGPVLMVMLAVIVFFRRRLHKRQMIAKHAQDELAESEKRFRLLIENAPIPLAILKYETGLVKMLNRSFEDTFGYQIHELYDIDCWWRMAYPNPVYREEIRSEWTARLNTAQKNKRNLEPIEAMVTCRDGRERYIQCHAILLGELSLIVLIDLTEKNNHEKALVIAKEIAEQATNAKSLFLANMSHEIRTPMNAILGLTTLLEKTELDERQRDYLSKIYSSGEFLLGLLNDILDLSKVEAGKLELEQKAFSLTQLLEPLRGLVLSSTQHKAVEVLFYIAPDVPPILTGDILRLGQILTNLLGNAIKFSQKGDIELGIATLPSPYSRKIKLHLWVKDMGIGMSEAQLSRVFEAFSQADASTTRRFGGTGLGLTIAKRLVELMDGDIKVNSQLDKGTCFDIFIYLPQTIDVSLAEDVSTKKQAILIVDNNATSAQAIQSMAERLHWQVDTLSTLHAQMHIATHYDYILVDADFATQAYCAYLPSNIPKVLLQTPWQENDPMLGDMIEFVATLTKPIDEHTLLALTAKHRSKQNRTDESPLLVCRVLLVEDNPINQLVGVKLLESFGAVVDVAENGHVALSLLQHIDNHYDMVLMDLQMPVMDGLETTRQLRLIEQFSHLPVIAMTANVLATDRQACFEAGMNDFMSKPIRLKELREKISQWLK